MITEMPNSKTDLILIIHKRYYQQKAWLRSGIKEQGKGIRVMDKSKSKKINSLTTYHLPLNSKLQTLFFATPSAIFMNKAG